MRTRDGAATGSHHRLSELAEGRQGPSPGTSLPRKGEKLPGCWKQPVSLAGRREGRSRLGRRTATVGQRGTGEGAGSVSGNEREV